MKNFLGFFLSLMITSGISTDVYGQGKVNSGGSQQLLFPVGKDKKWGYIDQTGKLVIPMMFDEVDKYNTDGVFENNLIPVKKGSSWGYCNPKGEMIIEPKFAEAGKFESGLARVCLVKSEGFFSSCETSVFINTDGKPVITYKEYDFGGLFDGSYFHEGLICVKEKASGKYVYLNNKGTLTFAQKFETKHTFSEGLAAFKKGEVFGFMDKTGKEIIPAQYASINDFSEGIAVVKKPGDATYYFIDKTGKTVGSTKEKLYTLGGLFAGSLAFREGVCIFEKDGKLGYLDKTGKIVIPPVYNDANAFHGGIAAVNVSGTSEDVWGMKIWKGGWGFIDKTGKLIIPANYYKAMPFSEGLAVVCMEKDKWGVIDKTGKWLIQPQYKEYPSNFEGGISQIKGDGYYDGNYGYIDKTGKTVWPLYK